MRPKFECIGKGKAHRPYEFEVKLNIETARIIGLSGRLGGLAAIIEVSVPASAQTTIATLMGQPRGRHFSAVPIDKTSNSELRYSLHATKASGPFYTGRV